MPMDSFQIANLTGNFNQQVMMGMQHSAMLSQMYGGYTPSALYQPIPSQGQQLAGMALQSAGQMTMGALGGSALNSFGGGMATPFAQTGQHLIGQAMYGMHQQQMLDANLRTAYRFNNEFGGRGFTTNQMAGVGADLRMMSMQRGPGGETTNFEELGRLASNMGRMGMAEGVRSVKDFNEKFKQMLGAVKTIATELGTSLEEAQRVMASLKGSGVFRNQGAVAGMMRQGAVSGNLGISEVSGMALIGSQISRAIGGRGSSGALAGINAISQIGSAQQAGILNEEDIYNVTGLTGAEGRRAFAQQNLAGDAQFFSGQLGRRALAAIAGKDGTLDEAGVQAFMSGGVGTGGTMSRAYSNLGKIGRANFIRNEGRLRGEALRAFGGLGRAVVARNWLDDRGMDLNEMDDRSMLFFQRKFNVGRDEADQIIKMARNVDRIQLQRQQAGENDVYSQMLERSQRAQSPQEIVRRAEMARTGVQNELRQTGADLYGGLSTGIGEMLQRAQGGFIDRRRADLAGSINQVYRGGTGARSVLEREFGIASEGGRFTTQGMTAGEGAAYERLFGTGGMSTAQFNRFLGGQAQGLRDAGYDLAGVSTQEDYAKLQGRMHQQQMGFLQGGSAALRGGVDATTRAALRSDIAAGGLQGRGDEFLRNVEKSLDKLSTEQGKKLAEAFRKATDEERARMAGDVLKAIGGEGLMQGRFGGAGMGAPIGGGRYATEEAEQAAIGRELTSGLSRQPFQRYSTTLRQQAGDLSLMLGGGETTAGRFVAGLAGRGSAARAGLDKSLLTSAVGQLDDLRQYMRGNREDIAGAVAEAPRDLLKGLVGGAGTAADWLTGGRATGAMRGLVGPISSKGGLIDRMAAATGYTSAVEDPLRGAARGALGGYNDRQATAVAQFLRGQEGRGTLQSVLSSDRETSQAARTTAETRRMELASIKQRTQSEDAEYRALQGVEAAAVLRELGPQATQEQLSEAARKLYGEGATAEQLVRAGQATGAEFYQQQSSARRQMFQGVGATARREQEEAARRAPDVRRLREEGKISGATADYMEQMKKQRDLRATITGVQGQEGADLRSLQEAHMLSERQERQRLSMSVTDRERLANELAAGGELAASGTIRREVSIEKRLQRSGAAGGEREARTIAGLLGADFQRGELGGTTTQQVAAISQRLGVGMLEGGKAKEVEEQLQRILSGSERGEAGGTRQLSRAERAQAIRQLQERPELVEAQQKQQEESSKRNDPSYRALVEVRGHVETTSKNTNDMRNLLQNLPNEMAKALNRKIE